VAFERGKKLLSTNEVNITEGGCDIDEKIVLPITLYSTRQKGFEAKRAKLLVRRKVAATAAPQQPTHVVMTPPTHSLPPSPTLSSSFPQPHILIFY
jgi:hypothetical protein